jgi:hypothetical protein
LCFYFNSFFLLVFSAITNIIFLYPQGYTYHRLGTTVLDRRFTDGGEVCQPYAPAELYSPCPMKILGTDLCWSLSKPQGHRAAGRILGQVKNPVSSSGIQAACRIVPQPTALQRFTEFGCTVSKKNIEQLKTFIFTGI